MRTEAADEVAAAIDRTIWYAGWCDKYLALASTRNPVAGPHFNFSTAEPTGGRRDPRPGRTGAARPRDRGRAGFRQRERRRGRRRRERDPRTAIVFAECVATSDLPAGACNILTGTRAELGPILAGHMDVNALHGFGLDRRGRTAPRDVAAAENVKRARFEDSPPREAWFDERYDDLERVLNFTELKTIWHPALI
jgi:hypothetical protein